MSFLPDSGWLKALQLPGKIVAGLFLFFCLLLVFDVFGLVSLNDFGKLAKPTVIISALLFGCLSLASIGAIFYEALTATKKISMFSERRKIKRAEQNERRVEMEAAALKRLDYLTEQEISYVAGCLRKNEQSFLTYVHSGPVTNLQAMGVVTTAGGTHHQDHYPFYFRDFAWAELLERKDEFIQKDDDYNR